MKGQTLLIAIALILLIVGFWYFKSDSNATPNLQSNAVVPEELASFGATLDTGTLDEVEHKLSGAIFQSPVFASLKDFTLDVVQEPQGRRNPFAPLGMSGDTAPKSATTTPASSSAQ